jgi:hypothetical protein
MKTQPVGMFRRSAEADLDGAVARHLRRGVNLRHPIAWLAVLGWCAGGAAPATAHRVDEYLQATRVTIEVDRISLEIDLTPGVTIASRVLALIDTDHDGQISDAEGDAYARCVLGSASLSVDGRPVPLTLTGRQFPAPQDVRLGTGMIRVSAIATASSGGNRHRVVYRNAHLPEMSVYLVNALVPSNEHVQIGTQRRDPEQRSIAIDYDLVAGAGWMRAGWSAAALATLGLLGRVRQRGKPQAVADPCGDRGGDRRGLTAEIAGHAEIDTSSRSLRPQRSRR